MVDGPSNSDAGTAAGRSGWRAILQDPAVSAIAAYALVALLAAVAAYFTIFSQFGPWDDEGTLLVTLKAFSHGGVLYRDIYSEYGPFYYEVFGGLLALTGHAVTTDASRTTVVVIWVATSFLFGVGTQRLTGRLALGIVGMAAAFGALGVLVNEPMHPQGLCVLLLGTLYLIVSREPERRIGWAGAAVGAILAALLLTKVNLGLFAVAGLVVAAVWTFEPLSRRRWLLWLVVVAYLAMPFLVIMRDLKAEWARELILLQTMGMVAVLTAAWPMRGRKDGSGRLSRWLLAGVAGFAAAFIAILIAILLTGPSPADVYDGLVTQAMRVRDVLVLPIQFPPAALDAGIASVLAAVLTTRLRSSGGTPSIWPGLLRAAAGLTILFSITHIAPFGLNPSAGNPDTVPVLLAWVAAIPPVGVEETAYKRFFRMMFPAVAVAEALQVYPVAGSQTGIAAVAFVPVAALCLADALASLQTWATARGGLALSRLGIAVPVVSIALAVQFTLDASGKAAVRAPIAYDELESLPLPGATALHLQPTEVETYTELVNLIHRNRCTTFIGYPNLNSLYLWTGIEPPPPAAPGAWIKALDSGQQQRVVDELRASPRPCAIINQSLAGFWLQGGSPPDLPLVNYILNDFKPVAKAGEFEFALPKSP